MARKHKVETISVKVMRTGGRTVKVKLEGDEPTIDDALSEADIELSKGDRVRLNNEPATGDTVLEEGDIITVGGKISGGKN